MAFSDEFAVGTVKLLGTFAAGASLLIAVSGCSVANPGGGSSIEAIAIHDWDPEDPGMQALLTGMLQDQSGCLVVAAADQSEPVVVAFPRSLARWDADRQVLEYGGREFRVGDTVWMGGGGVNAPLELPDACESIAGGGVFFVQDTELLPPEQREGR